MSNVRASVIYGIRWFKLLFVRSFQLMDSFTITSAYSYIYLRSTMRMGQHQKKVNHRPLSL